VAAEVIDDDNVAGFEGGDEKLFHIGREADGVDRTVEDRRGVDPVMAERGKEGQGLPVAIRRLGVEPLPAPAPSMGARHVCLGPGLINEHQTPGIDLSLIALPTPASPRHVGTLLLAGQHAFF